MLLDAYKEAGLLFNLNFLSNTSTAGTSSFRGELVLIPGEAGDAKGHSKPPVDLMRGVALLADTKLKMVIGALDNIASLSTFVSKYKDDFDPEIKVLIYVVNISKAVQVEVEGVNFVLIPLAHGVPWNEALDEFAIEKSDLKGQSAADKLLTVYDEFKSYKPSYPSVSLDEVLASATTQVREGWGAI